MSVGFASIVPVWRGQNAIGRLKGVLSVMEMSEDENPFEAQIKQIRERIDHHETKIINSAEFQNGLLYLQGIAADLLLALTCVRLQGTRYAAGDNYLLFRFAPSLVESILAITLNAKEGLQNAARRELRFLLEASVKLSSRDFHPAANSFDERLSGLDGRDQRFGDYVASLAYFEGFEKPDEANASILSLYSELSRYVHATVPQFERAMARTRRDEGAGFETVATLNQFNKLAFQVYELVLIRIFHGAGLSMAGDIFVDIIDYNHMWRFHKGRFVKRLSKCFDYKQERRAERDEF
jgi:hypothetical protein